MSEDGMSDIVERLLADKSEPTIYENVVRKIPATALEVEAAHEITRLRAALESERERCAKVADEMAEAAQDGIDILTKNGMADITGRHAVLGRMAKNIAADIRALPPPEGKP